jgi:hypothetical protein
MIRTILVAVLAILIFISPAPAHILRVPADYSKVQLAVNAAVNGDTVVVYPGTYFENVIFRGKKIVMTSRYYETRDVNFILSTIINGGVPVNPDTASCVLIINGEDSTAVLQGFTLTGGKGTAWKDEHSAGTYREGGGILVALSSPVTRNNLIIDNEAINATGLASGGGGGIRCGDGSPRILNNVIMSNKGMYGGGIVLNYCSGAVVKNNIILHNAVYQALPGKPTYGGGGIWINNVKPRDNTTSIFENNTICGNSSAGEGGAPAGAGGGFLIYPAQPNLVIRNNIVWGNSQLIGDQLSWGGAGSVTILYNDFQGGIAGTGNINVQPQFADSNLYLSAESPCVDAGDPDSKYNDPQKPFAQGSAEWPSLGGIRNDIGAYGGPGRSLFPIFSLARIAFPQTEFRVGQVIPGNTGIVAVLITNAGSTPLSIDSARIRRNEGNRLAMTKSFPFLISPFATDSILISWSPLVAADMQDTLDIFHKDPSAAVPQSVRITGSQPAPIIFLNTDEHNFGDINVNTPSCDTTFYVHNIGKAPDSVYVSLNYGSVKPDSALSISPIAFALAAGDSHTVLFKFFPPQVTKTFLNIFIVRVLIDSKFGVGTTHLEKHMRFHLVGTVPVGKQKSEGPASFSLEQNFPNPFNPNTQLRFSIPDSRFVTLRVFDGLGREVAELISEQRPAGEYEVQFDASNLASGLYLYRLQALRKDGRQTATTLSSRQDGNFVETKKMMLVK